MEKDKRAGWTEQQKRVMDVFDAEEKLLTLKLALLLERRREYINTNELNKT